MQCYFHYLAYFTKCRKEEVDLDKLHC